LQPITRDNEIAVYTDGFSVKHAIDEITRLSRAFPSIGSDFYDVLLERIKDLRFTNNRLTDAINNLIDNFHYPVPSVADIVGWGKPVKLLTYSDMCRIQDETGRAWKDYTKVLKNGKLFWISKADKEQFNIPDEL
jgi:hypothetical protein